MDRAFAVEVIGFNATERIVLGSIFNLSARRSPRYEQCPSGLGSRPDLLLVDGADAQHVEQARLLVAQREVPVVMVGDRDHGTGWPLVGRPLQWSRVFRAFDAAIGAAHPPGEGRMVDTSSRDVHAPFVHANPQGLPQPTRPNAPEEMGRFARAVTRSMALSRDPTGVNPAEPAPPAAAHRVIPNAPWVLVVDDSAPVREFMRQVLAPFAMNIDTADSGEKAIGMTAGRDYACIFLDVMLPGVDGYQVCKLIKSKPTGRRTPVIMLTSKSSPFDRIRGTMAGCDSYLTKPVEEARLRAVVTKLLAAHGHGAPVVARPETPLAR